jgi:hypothetical protein
MSYPITEEQMEDRIRKTTAENLLEHSSQGHVQQDLWTWAEDCPHTNPEDAEKYEGLDDLVDEWMQRNCAGLSFEDVRKSRDLWDLYTRNRRRAEDNIPLYVQYRVELTAYEAIHSGWVCMDENSYMGTCCLGCTEGDEDSGYEPGSCRRQESAREAQEEFFSLFTADWFEVLARHPEEEFSRLPVVAA